MAQPEQDPQINASSIKLPPFWSSDPELWFHQIEAQFTLRRITNQETKFNYVIGNLSADQSQMIMTPPQENQYNVLRQALIERYSATDQQKLQQLLQLQLGELKPTQLLREMRRLSPAQNDDILKLLFLQKLTPQSQAILSVQNVTLDELAIQADQINTIVNPSNVYAMSEQNKVASLEYEIKRLTTTIEQLSENTQSEKSLNGQQTVRPIKTSSSPRRLPSPSRGTSFSTHQRNHVCWYHQKWGSRAQNCSPPCSYQKNESQNQ